jgi:hypothetical protein
MSINGFWTAAPENDPARKFRFRILLGGEFAWWAKSCDKPKVNIPVYGKDEYYLGSGLPDVKPGEIVDFQPITMTFVDPAGTNSFASELISNFSFAGAECFPRIDGAKFKEVFGNVSIETIDSKGDWNERWTLNGAFPTSVDFGSLDYGSDELVEITMTWEYISFNYEYYLAESSLVSKTPASTSDINKLDGGYT